MEYLDNEKSFLGELKNIFHSLKGYHLVKKIKIIIKIVDTNFNSFIVTNLRPCVSNKPIVLVKVQMFESLDNARFNTCILQNDERE